MAFLQGINLLQQIQYFRLSRPKSNRDTENALPSSNDTGDSLVTRLTVHIACFISLFQTVIIVRWEYSVFIKRFGDLAALIKHDWVSRRLGVRCSSARICSRDRRAANRSLIRCLSSTAP
jgi:hypothetical protein